MGHELGVCLVGASSINTPLLLNNFSDSSRYKPQMSHSDAAAEMVAAGAQLDAAEVRPNPTPRPTQLHLSYNPSCLVRMARRLGTAERCGSASASRRHTRS